MVPEYADPKIRELILDNYRMMYLVQEKRVIILAFVYGGRDFGPQWPPAVKTRLCGPSY